MMLRALRQQLESLSLAGLTHLPRAEPVAPLGPAVPSPLLAPAVPVRTPISPQPPPPGAPPAEKRSAVAAQADVPSGANVPRIKNPDDERRAEVAKPQAAAAKPQVTGAPANQTTSARGQAALDILNEKVKNCTRCSELASTRTKTVFGVGDPAARIVFIGEAPGADEDLQGEPFVGKAGQLLNQIITASRLKREELYICNILKCRPPGNRTPAEDECLNCREFLEGQLAAIDPEYIVCWGAVAAQNLLASKLSIGKLRGSFSKYGRAKVLCTYHPSYLLRNPAAKKDVWQDMQFLMADMGVDLKKT